MNEILSHIAYLTQRHECVVMPGLGAFVARREPARFSAQERCFFPPRRVLTFTAAITHDDGLLASSVARREGVNFERASLDVARRLAMVARAMDVAGAVNIPGVGVLQMSADKRLEFIPALPDAASLSLPELRLAAPAAEQPSVVIEMPAHDAAPVRRGIRSAAWRRKVAGAAASVAVLLGLGMALSTPISSHTAQQATLALASSFTPPVPAAVQTVEPLPVPAGLTLCMALPADNAGLRAVSAPAASPARTGRYVMVVASLPSRGQAEAYIAADLSGAPLSILEKDGKFRVYISSGSTQAEAAERANSISGFESRYPGAWVCRR